jgi:PIN domain nuclease of toxin-antitoxin system
VEGDGTLSDVARQAIIDPGNSAYLSPVSAWEIVIKHALGRLILAQPPDSYVPAQREAHRIETLPLTEMAVLQIGKLPTLHRDPFDRMLVAQAISEGCVIATPDPLIRRYPVPIVW